MLRILAGLLVVATTQAAIADVIVDFTGSTAIIPTASQPLIVDGVQVYAFSHSGPSNGDAPFGTLTPRLLHRDANGLGVRSSFFDTNQLDGVGFSEMIRIVFPNPVELIELQLSLASNLFGADEFDMAIDNVDVDVEALFGDDNITVIGTALGGSTTALFDYSLDFSGKGLGKFTTLDLYTNNANDDFKVSRLHAVPEPTMLAIWSIVGGVGFMARRRRRSVAA